MPDEAPKKKISCKVRLAEPPDCHDRSSRAGFVLCWARYVGMKEKGLDLPEATREGWRQLKEKCKT